MRLIELEAAIKTACDAVEHYPSDWAVIEAAMRALPVAEERKHGHWIGKPIAGYSLVRCSVCFAFANNIERWNYCPNCGAKMDEVTK